MASDAVRGGPSTSHRPTKVPQFDEPLPPISYVANLSLNEPNPSIEHAVIVIHGSGRDPVKMFNGITDAAKKAGRQEETLIIAPKFCVEKDLSENSGANDVPFWSGRWRQGNKSLSTALHPRAKRISSFRVIDLFIAKICDKSVFPKLRTIAVTGHSAGGQFVNRYAAGNLIEDELLIPLGIRIRYVVANPSSYLYFTNERRVDKARDRFELPPPSVRGSNPRFDRYKYGLGNLNSYMRQLGAAGIRERYPRRNVVYLVGSKDTKTSTERFDDSHAAMLQGSNRLERAVIYWNYLRHVFGNEIEEHQRRAIVEGVGHSSYRIFNSPEGLSALFKM